VAKPFVKWAGGKSQLLVQLEPLYPKAFNSYFEPFLGGGAVYFDLRPGRAFLNDVNPALMASYDNIKRRPGTVIAILRDLEAKYLQGDKAARNALFYDIRSEYNALRNSIPRKTAYLIFLNKTCFNGMYRESSTGRFNVPFGKYENPRICHEENLSSVSALLKSASLTSVSFGKSVQPAREGDFVYFDPPYHPLTRTASFTSYHAGDFSEADQVRLHGFGV
jgi:DNA adenine methylase